MGTRKPEIACTRYSIRLGFRQVIGGVRIALSIRGGSFDQNVDLPNLEACGFEIEIQIHFTEFLQLFGDFQPNWSPDEKKIAFFSSRSGSPNIWEVEIASGTLRRLTSNSGVNVNPFYSPDGKLIAYQSDQSGRLEVWVMNADGSNPRRLTNVSVTGHFMRWAADGLGIVFRCTCNGKSSTMKVSLSGGEPQPFAETMMGGSHMSFSPDRTRIMDVVGHKVLWVSPVNGGKTEKVYEFPDPDVRIDYPVWSPDGRWVMFDRFRPQGGDIWAISGVE